MRWNKVRFFHWVVSVVGAVVLIAAWSWLVYLPSIPPRAEGVCEETSLPSGDALRILQVRAGYSVLSRKPQGVVGVALPVFWIVIDHEGKGTDLRFRKCTFEVRGDDGAPKRYPFVGAWLCRPENGGIPPILVLEFIQHRWIAVFGSHDRAEGVAARVHFDKRRIVFQDTAESFWRREIGGNVVVVQQAIPLSFQQDFCNDPNSFCRKLFHLFLLNILAVWTLRLLWRCLTRVQTRKKRNISGETTL